VHISIDGLYANDLQKFLGKLVQSTSLCHRLFIFQKAKNYANLTTESGLKQKFSLLQGKVVSIKDRFKA